RPPARLVAHPRVVRAASDGTTMIDHDADGTVRPPLVERGLDPLRVDWDRVQRAVYRVEQRYRYTYSAPVSDVRQRLVMIPPARQGDPRLLERHLVVRGTSGARPIPGESDAFGNRVAHVRAPRVEHAVEFEVCYAVEVRPDAGHAWPVPGGPRRWR